LPHQPKPNTGENDSSVEIRLIGFGDDRPACFDYTNRFRCHLTHPVTPRWILDKAGFPVSTGLILMKADTVIPENRWDEALINSGDQITLMSAIEGG
jgi:sulfur carrier protein ThiS